MDGIRFQELKNKLLHDKELAGVWWFFLDHMASNADFMAMGEPAEHSFLEAVIRQVGQQWHGSDGVISGLLLTRIKEAQLVHGGFRMGGRFGAIFFFEDAGTGLIAVPEYTPSIEVKYARFSGQLVRKQDMPSMN